MNHSSNKIIIISTAFFLLVSFVFLSWSENKQADINSKNIWMIYFQNAKNSSLNFVIENHSKNTDFHWQILSDKDVKAEGDATISLGETKPISTTLNEAEITGQKMTVSVSTNNEKKEIYKIF